MPYEKRMLVRKRKLLKTVTYIAVKERLACIITIESHVHNALQKVPPT